MSIFAKRNAADAVILLPYIPVFIYYINHIVMKLKLAFTFLVFLFVSALFITGCTDKPAPYIPTGPGFNAPKVDSTLQATLITDTSVETGGAVSSDGGSLLTETGVCYDTIIKPTINSNKIVSGNLVGTFSINVTGLKPATTYFLKAYAKNAAGITYGNRISFTTLP